MRNDLTAERLRAVLHYDPETGVFTRRLNGEIAGCADTCRNVQRIRVDGALYLAHRLAWLYMTGAWPACWVDHRDNNPANNRWSNLREATPSENARNKRCTGVIPLKGVSRGKGCRRYQATIRIHGQHTHLGSFDTAEEAHVVYCTAAEEHHGDFARTA